MNNNISPLMSYPDLPEGYSPQDDITRPQQYHQQPALAGGYQPDPYLTDDYLDPMEAPVQELQEGQMPAVPTLKDNRRLS